MTRFLTVAFIGALTLVALELSAQSESGTVFQEGNLDKLTAEFKAATQTWYPTLKAYARYLLLLLFVIGLSWNAIQTLLKNEDWLGFTRLAFIQIFTIGFYLVAIDNIDGWSAALVDTFRQIATDILPPNNPLMVNGELKLTPSTVVGMGKDLWDALMDIDVGWRPHWDVLFAAAGLVTAILFAGIAAYLTLLLIEGLVIIAGGVVFLGFAGTDWTIDTAKNYLRFCLSFAVKMFAVYLIMAVGITILQTSVFDPLNGAQLASVTPSQYGDILMEAVFYACTVPLIILVLSFGVPAVFQQIVGGIGSASNFALNSVLTTTLMTAASVGQQALKQAGVFGVGAGLLGHGAHSAGMGNVGKLLGTPSFTDQARAYWGGASDAAGAGMKAGFSEAWSGAKDKMSGPAMNQGSFVNGIASHFHPETFGPKSPSGAGGSASAAGG